MIGISGLFQRKPYVYGIVYLGLIPIYALLYYLLPNIIGNDRSFIECLYFSTVTITTLGYGDIIPLGEWGQIVTASESVLGVISIGLFLNAIASARSDMVHREQEEKEARVFLESQRARLNGHFSLIQPLVERYRLSVIDITQSNQFDPNFKLNDMKNLHKPTRLLRVPYLRPAIQGYFEVQVELRREISSLITDVDLRCFLEIEKQCLEIVSAIDRYDYSGAILSAPDTRAGDRSLAEFAGEMLERYDGDYRLSGDGHILDAYISLYYQIKIVMNCLTKLETAVKEEVKAAKEQ